MMKYISEHLPKWIIGILASGFLFAITTTWTISTLWNDLRRDLIQIQCRIGMVDVLPEEDQRRCSYIKPMIEDLEDLIEDKEEASGIRED